MSLSSIPANLALPARWESIGNQVELRWSIIWTGTAATSAIFALIDELWPLEIDFVSIRDNMHELAKIGCWLGDSPYLPVIP